MKFRFLLFPLQIAYLFEGDLKFSPFWELLLLFHIYWRDVICRWPLYPFLKSINYIKETMLKARMCYFYSDVIQGVRERETMKKCLMSFVWQYAVTPVPSPQWTFIIPFQAFCNKPTPPPPRFLLPSPWSGILYIG